MTEQHTLKIRNLNRDWLVAILGLFTSETTFFLFIDELKELPLSYTVIVYY